MLNHQSKIEKLTAELCPNGVELRELGELLEYEQPGNFIVKSTEYSDDLATPVLTAGKSFILGYIGETNGIYKASKEYPVIIFDDFTTSFHWVDFEFKVKSSAMKMLRVKKDIGVNFKFIYFAMRCIHYIPSDHTRHWISQYSKFKIPLPPLAIQKEIVKILNSFTELEVELEAELEAREKQYEYYRSELLIFGDIVEFKSLGEIGNLFIGSFVKKTEQDSGFDYPVYNGGVQPTGYFNQFNSKKDSVVISARGANCGFVNYLTTDFWAGNSCYVIKNLSEDIFPKFLFYILKRNEPNLYSLRQTSGVPAINSAPLSKFKIPIPTLTEQKRIVSILDKFDALVNDISIGLPAEFSARRQQYEYYRDKLLTFKEYAK